MIDVYRFDRGEAPDRKESRRLKQWINRKGVMIASAVITGAVSNGMIVV